MKKSLNELSQNELEKVFSTNEHLQEDVYSAYFEHKMFWVREQMKKIENSLSDYSIGGIDSFLAIKPDKELEFMNGILKLQNDYNVFSELEIKRVEKVYDIVQKYFDCDMDREEFDFLQLDARDGINMVATMLCNYWDDSLEYNHVRLKEFFLEYYIEERMCDGTFFVDTETYELFEEVHYIISYK